MIMHWMLLLMMDFVRIHHRNRPRLLELAMQVDHPEPAMKREKWKRTNIIFMTIDFSWLASFPP